MSKIVLVFAVVFSVYISLIEACPDKDSLLLKASSGTDKNIRCEGSYCKLLNDIVCTLTKSPTPSCYTVECSWKHPYLWLDIDISVPRKIFADQETEYSIIDAYISSDRRNLYIILAFVLPMFLVYCLPKNDMTVTETRNLELGACCASILAVFCACAFGDSDGSSMHEE